jgi:hypothetical protein
VPDIKTARAGIEAAIRRLPVLAEQEWRVPVLVAAFAMMTDKIDFGGKVPPHFQCANQMTVEKQLVELRTRASRLAMTIERGGATNRARQQLALLIRSLSGDALEALGNAATAIVGGQPCFVNVGYLRVGLPDDLDRGEPISADALRIIAGAAEAALERAQARNQPGRPPNLHAQEVARVAAGAYRNLTGQLPSPVPKGNQTRGSQEVVRLVGAIFKALGVAGDPISYARPAVSRMRRGVRGNEK